MQSKSLRQALADAEKEAPSTGGGGGGVWESGDYPVEVVTTSVTRDFDGNPCAPRIGLHCQNEEGRKRWLDLIFDESNPKGYAATGRKLKALGLDETIDALEQQYPNDSDAQLDALAVAMTGIKFVAKIDKVEKTSEKGKFINFFDVRTLIAGPSTTPTPTAAPSGFGGFGGAGVMGG